MALTVAQCTAALLSDTDPLHRLFTVAHEANGFAAFLALPSVRDWEAGSELPLLEALHRFSGGQPLNQPLLCYLFRRIQFSVILKLVRGFSPATLTFCAPPHPRLIESLAGFIATSAPLLQALRASGLVHTDGGGATGGGRSRRSRRRGRGGGGGGQTDAGHPRRGGQSSGGSRASSRGSRASTRRGSPARSGR